MVSIKNSMYYKSIYYVLFMFIFIVLGYVFLDSGFNTKTKSKVDYEDSSEVIYKVRYFDDTYSSTNDRYVSEMVDYIEVIYNYNNYVSEYVNGYYRYNVDISLIAYEEDITDSLWERKYDLVDKKTVLIDENNINNIKIDDKFIIDFSKYRAEINSFIDEYGIDVSGYLQVNINILEALKFDSFDNECNDNKIITINVPLTDNVFKVNVNNVSNQDSYYDFSNNKAMNLIFLLIGAFCISVALALLVLIIKQFKKIYINQNEYNKKLKKILSKYDDCIVKVKRFYVNKKYNMIYVDSFSELMDVYEKKNKMISFKEMKRNSEAIFVIIDDEDAWIYKLKNN